MNDNGTKYGQFYLKTKIRYLSVDFHLSIIYSYLLMDGSVFYMFVRVTAEQNE